MRFLAVKICFFMAKLSNALSRCFQDLPCAILPPKDLSELYRRYYSRPDVISAWKESFKAGLSDSEEEFARKFLRPGDKVCVVGCGAGREIAAICAKGLEAEGFDISKDMVAAAKENLRSAGLNERIIYCGSFEDLTGKYKAVFLGTSYGAIVSKKQRIKILKQLIGCLLPGGAVYICCGYKPASRLEKFRFGLWKTMAFVFFGNREVELGDCIIDDGEFNHYFFSPEDLLAEIKSAGLNAEPSLGREAFFIQI